MTRDKQSRLRRLFAKRFSRKSTKKQDKRQDKKRNDYDYLSENELARLYAHHSESAKQAELDGIFGHDGTYKHEPESANMVGGYVDQHKASKPIWVFPLVPSVFTLSLILINIYVYLHTNISGGYIQNIQDAIHWYVEGAPDALKNPESTEWLQRILGVVTFIVGDGAMNQERFELYKYNTEAVMNGETYRLFTSMFLHGNFLHIGSNLFALFVMGRALEPLIGNIRFIVLYMASGLLANVYTYYHTTVIQPDLAYSAVGASGAIYGLFGVFLVLIFYIGGKRGAYIAKTIVPLVIFGVIQTLTIPYISTTAHIGGLVSGFILALILLFPSRHRF